MGPIRVTLADDHRLVRAGFRGLLAGMTGVEVVTEADDGLEALDQILELRPDVVLADLAMPGLNGIELCARVTQAALTTRVVILSMHTEEEQVLRAVHAGVCGYIRKDSSLAELELAVRAAASGETFFCPIAARHLADHVRRGGATGGPLDRLTPRHREILQMIGEGHSTKQIALKLGLSVKTVEAHRAEMMERLDVHDLAAVVRFAIRTGLVDPEF